MRAPIILCLLLLAGLLSGAVVIEEQGDFVKIKEVDGAETLQLLFLRKRDISAVTYAKTDFNTGVMSLIMHYQGASNEAGNSVIYHVGVPPNKDGETMATRVIKMLESPQGGVVIKREFGFPE